MGGLSVASTALRLIYAEKFLMHLALLSLHYLPICPNKKSQEILRLFVVLEYKKIDRSHSESVNLSWHSLTE